MKETRGYQVSYLTQDALDDLVAIAYQTGLKGKHTIVARQMILDGIKRYRDGLAPKERAALEEILGNVRLIRVIDPAKKRKPQRSNYIKKKLRGGI